MMRWMIVPLSGLILSGTPAAAQDMNTLGRHLEHQQWKRVQDHQNRSRTMKARKTTTTRSRPANNVPCSADALSPQEKRALHAGYASRLKASGKASADAWVKDEGIRFRRKLVADGVCPS